MRVPSQKTYGFNYSQVSVPVHGERTPQAQLLNTNDRMLQILPTFRNHRSHCHQVRFILTQFSLLSSKNFFSTQFAELPHQALLHRSSKTDAEFKDLSSIDFSLIKNEVLYNSLRPIDTYIDAKANTFPHHPLKDCIFELSRLSPGAIRRFWRVAVLKPQDVRQILLDFDFDSGNFEVDLKKVESLWGLFRWASNQSTDFEHLPQSYNIMAKMLVRAGLFNEAEFTLSWLGDKGHFLDSHEIFSHLIEGYVLKCDIEKAIAKYNHMRSLGLVPSVSCYIVLLDFLVQMNEPQMVNQVCLDVSGIGLTEKLKEKNIFEKVVRFLCAHGKVQEARDLVKSILPFDMQPGSMIINAIVTGYCKKKDYNDILTFFLDVGIAPDITSGNKAIHSMSMNFGAERAYEFMHELEELGFFPDEISFGILIGQSCRERRLTKSFIYISEMLSRNLKPHVYSYNALISGLFKEGMWKESYDILQELKDSGIPPNLSTFKVLLAGFCKARQFSEVKRTIGEMAGCGLVELSSRLDQLSVALTVLGVSPMSVKVKRDSDIQLSKTEFFDELGNGLYLDTDLDWYDNNMDMVLDDAMLPNFDSFILQHCDNSDIKSFLGISDEMAHWGQELSLSSVSTLLSRLSASRVSIWTITHPLDKMSCSIYELAPGTLNMLVQTYSKRGFTHKAKMIFNNLARKQMKIENDTYTALLMGLGKRSDLRGLHHCWKLFETRNWSPDPKDIEALLKRLWQPKLLRIALEVLETFLTKTSYRSLNIIHAFFEKLCHGGFASAAYIFAKELLQQGHALDEVIYNHLLGGFCKENKPAEALAIVDAMVFDNLAPPLDILLQLIPLLCRAGKFEQAIKLIDSYIESQSSARLSAYGALVNGFCRLGRVEEAVILLHKIPLTNHIPSNELCNTLLQGYCQVKDLKRVAGLLGIMIRKKLCMTISCYRNLLRLTCVASNFSAALSLKDYLDTDFSDSAFYTILIFYLSSSLNMPAVEEVIDELKMKGLKLEGVTYDYVIRGYSHCNDSSHSLLYLRSMISEGLCPSTRSLSKVIGCLCHNDEIEKALELSASMESRGWFHSSTIQNSIFEAFLAQGNLPEALKFLDRVVSKKLVPKNINYNHIIKRLCQHGELEKANDCLNLMICKGNFVDSTSFDHLIKGFCVCNKLDLALDYHTEMIYRNLKPSSNTWEILVHGLCESGLVVEGEKLLQWMIQKGETPSREMYSSVISKYRSSNNLGKVTELLRTMQQSGYEPDFETHWSLISNYRHHNNVEETNNKRPGFLSKLLSGTEFAAKDSGTKIK